MTQSEMKKQLEALHDACNSLINDHGVFVDTALYAYLRSAEYCLLMATVQSKDYIELTEQEGGHE